MSKAHYISAFLSARQKYENSQKRKGYSRTVLSSIRHQPNSKYKQNVLQGLENQLKAAKTGLECKAIIFRFAKNDIPFGQYNLVSPVKKIRQSLNCYSTPKHNHSFLHYLIDELVCVLEKVQEFDVSTLLCKTQNKYFINQRFIQGNAIQFDNAKQHFKFTNRATSYDGIEQFKKDFFRGNLIISDQRQSPKAKICDQSTIEQIANYLGANLSSIVKRVYAQPIFALVCNLINTTVSEFGYMYCDKLQDPSSVDGFISKDTTIANLKVYDNAAFLSVDTLNITLKTMGFPMKIFKDIPICLSFKYEITEAGFQLTSFSLGERYAQFWIKIFKNQYTKEEFEKALNQFS